MLLSNHKGEFFGSFPYDPPARSLDRGMALGSEGGASSLGKTKV